MDLSESMTFLKKHNIRLSRKEVEDLVDDIKDATENED